MNTIDNIKTTYFFIKFITPNTKLIIQETITSICEDIRNKEKKSDAHIALKPLQTEMII